MTCVLNYKDMKHNVKCSSLPWCSMFFTRNSDRYTRDDNKMNIMYVYQYANIYMRIPVLEKERIIVNERFMCRMDAYMLRCTVI